MQLLHYNSIRLFMHLTRLELATFRLKVEYSSIWVTDAKCTSITLKTIFIFSVYLCTYILCDFIFKIILKTHSTQIISDSLNLCAIWTLWSIGVIRQHENLINASSNKNTLMKICTSYIYHYTILLVADEEEPSCSGQWLALLIRTIKYISR